MLQHFDQTNHGMLSHIHGDFHTRGAQGRPASSEELRIEAGFQWLGIGARLGLLFDQLFAERMDEFSGEQIATRLPGDDHDAFWSHN